MAYRRYRKKYSPRRRRPRMKNNDAARFGRSVGGLASSAYSGVQYLKKLINVEKHKHNVEFNATPSDTGDITSLVNIAQGDGHGQRTGETIRLQGGFWRFAYTKHASATTTCIRQIIIQDTRQITDTVPTITDVLEDPAAATVPLCLAPLNQDNVGRYKILKDDFFTLSDDKPIIFKKDYLKNNSHIRYNGSATTDISANGIYLMFISDQQTNQPTVKGVLRMTYTDN